MSLKGTGTMLAFFGLGALVLPFFGLQFKILNLLGGFSWIVALVLIVVGIGLFFC